MAYQFIDAIADIEAQLDYDAEAAKKELQKIDSRQAELQSELAALESRQLRAQTLKSSSDLICPDCYIIHGEESPVKGIDSPDDHTDRFRCRKCRVELSVPTP